MLRATLKNDFWEWDGDTASPTYNTWVQKANFGGVARYGSIGFSIGDKGYVGVGRDGALVYKQDFWEWDQTGNIWTQAVNFGGTARNVAVGFSIGNRAYMGVGYGVSYKKDFWEWNPVPLASAIGTNPLCFGQCDGTASTNVSGGTLPYTYLWSNSQTTQTATGLCVGTYTITVTDADSDTSTATVVLTQPPLLTATTTATAVSCFGGGNGTAAATAAGGTPSYTYSWSNGGTQSQISNLTSQIYSVTITDTNGCTNTATVNITEPTALTSGISSQTNILCNGASTGSAEVSVNGGTPAYTYSWSNGQSTSSATGLSAGNYTATITDANGCTSTGTVAITEPTALTASVTTNTATCLTSNGNVSASASGGIPGYIYSWSGGQTTSTATGLFAGTYTITVTDANGCTTSNFANLTNLGGDSVSITSSTNVTCNGGNDGSAVSSISGVTTPHTYSWNTVPVQTMASATGLSAGIFNVTITDGAGCIDIATVTITEPPAINISFSNTNLNCNGGSGGTASASVSGGIPGYTYSWSNGETSPAATGLSAGVYTLTITDASVCTMTGTVAITAPGVLVVSTNTVSPVCSGSCTTLIASSSGGNGGYSYIWQPGNLTTSVVTVCPTATTDYTVTATDIANCMDTAFATMTVNPLPVVVFTLNPDTVCINASPFALTGGLPNGGTYSGAGVLGVTFYPAVAGSGTHAINYSYSDTNGCTDSAAAQIFVDPCTGIQHTSNIQSALFFPNPSTGMFSVTLGNSTRGSKYDLEIYNMLGEKVYSISSFTPHLSPLIIDLSNSPKGIYFYQIALQTSGNIQGHTEDVIATGKLIIQ